MVLLCLCQACQQVPPVPIDPAARAVEIEKRNLHDQAVLQALVRCGQPLPDDGRWSLDQLTVAAWTLRPDIAVARAELEAATLDERTQGQRPNPTADLTSERVTNADPGAKPWVLGAGLGLVFETAGKRDIRRHRALANTRAQEAQLGQTLWQARQAVRDALLGQLMAARTLALDDREVTLRRDYLHWVDAKRRYGAATGGEQLTAAEALSHAEGQRGLDRAALASASSALATAVGVGSSGFAGIAPVYPDLRDIPDLRPATLADARSSALQNRLDIRAALAEYQMAEQDLRAAVARQYPDLSLGPGYLLDQADHKITLSASLPLPLFHGESAAIDSAAAARRVAAARFDQVQMGALGDIDAALARYRTIRAAVAAADRARRQAVHGASAARRRLDAGAADRGELLRAQVELLLRHRDCLTARELLLQAIGALENGTQIPLFPPSVLQPSIPSLTSEAP